MEVKVVYSIGVRCHTENLLKNLNLIKFSSLFGSINIRNYENIIKCFDTNFNILFDESNLIYSKDIPAMCEANNRTLHKIFDNVNDYDSATIPHHDLSCIDHKQHFLRAINRLNYIKDQNIPILFVNISMEYDNSYYDPCLVDSIIKSGFNNMKILSIFRTNTVSEIQLVKISEFMIIYKIPYFDNDEKYESLIEDIIRKHFNCDNLMNINDFPNDSINHVIKNET
jgi:hypothetical protein